MIVALDEEAIQERGDYVKSLRGVNRLSKNLYV